MNTNPPYRKRCQGQGDVCVEGAFFTDIKSSDTAQSYAPTLSPTPTPIPGPVSLPDCPPPTGSSPGDNWSSAFIGAAELWQGAAQDMLQVQTFAKAAMEQLGVCHKYGFKKYAGKRQWPGMYGWNSPDAYGSGTDRTKAPDTIRYRTLTPALSYSGNTLFWQSATSRTGAWTEPKTGSASGSRTVNFLSGEITSSLLTTESKTTTWPPSLPARPHWEEHSYSGGAGWTSNMYSISGVATRVTTDIASGASCAIDSTLSNPPIGPLQITIPDSFDIATIIAAWNTAHPTAPLPAITDPNSYNESAVDLSKNWADPARGAGAGINSNISINFSRTATVYTITFSQQEIYQVTTYPEESDWSLTGTLTLSDPCTAASATATEATDILNDIERNLLSQYKLNGQEPWRTDAWTSIMPLVCRREVQTNVSPAGFNPATSDDWTVPVNDSNQNAPFTTSGSAGQNGQASADSAGYPPNSVGWSPTYTGPPQAWIPTYTQRAWFDPAAYFWYFTSGESQLTAAALALKLMMDGAIIGAPSAGPEGWFDFYYVDNRFCEVSGVLVGYLFENGGNLADCNVSLSDPALTSGPAYSTFLPGNATHWTGNVEAHNIPRGALIDLGGIYGHPATDPIVEIKSAFVRLPVPSYNFARPCGSDRVLIDETTAQCFILLGLTLNAPLPDGGAYPALSSQQVLLYGTSGNDGIYTGCSQIGSVLTLGTKVASLPNDYFHAYGGYFQYGFAGIVRFSGLNGSKAAAALCGRQVVTTSNGGAGVTHLAFAAPQTNLRTGDTLDFWDQFMAAQPANLAVTRIDDINFTVPAAFSTMTGVFYATSHGAANWYWNDSAQKFDFRHGSWSTSNRVLTGGDPTVTFNGCLQDCLMFTPCDPQVFAFTPNNDVDDGWQSDWLTFVADGVYGSRVQGNAEFEIDDLLYQLPLVPTGGGTAYIGAPDDGTCASDNLSANPELIYAPPPPRMEALCSPPDGTGGNGAGPTRNEAAPDLPRDALFNVTAWPAMQQPGNPGLAVVRYTIALETWLRYKNELSSGNSCRWVAWEYAWQPQLGNGM